jgi:hypothetical protein
MIERVRRGVVLSATTVSLLLGATGCGEEKKKADPLPPWTEVATKFEKPLHAAWVVSPTDAIAVGAGGLIVQFDGTAWKPVESGTTEDLIALWGSGVQRVWAVGANGTIVTRADGAWTVATDRRGLTLRAVCGRSADDVWIFGDEGLALRNTGSGFEEVSVPLPESVEGAFMDATGTGLFVGAESGMGTVTGTFDGEDTWARVVRSDTGIGAITDVWGRLEPMERAPFIWAAGTNTAGNGVLARWMDDRWNIVVSGLGEKPAAVFPTAEGMWLGATSALKRVDADDPDAEPETQVVAGPVRDIQGAGTLLIAVGGQSDGRIWTRVIDAE